MPLASICSACGSSSYQYKAGEGNMMQNRVSAASPYTIGVPVRPIDFRGYADQVVQFFRQCVFGPVLQPTRILGLRRAGKTSFLKYIASEYVPEALFTEIRQDQLKLAYLDLEFISSPSDFFIAVHDAAEKTGTTPARQTDEPTTARSFTRWLENFLAREKGKKLIVLMDEFERIHASATFDSDFFGFLRFLASSYSEQLTWVTASAADLHTLDKNEKTSPFWNIFRNTPIMMGGLDATAAERLVREPALKLHVEFIREEVSEILFLAGKIPYFIQAVADEWFQLKSENRPLREIREQIIEILTHPANQVQRILDGYWETLTDEKKNLLTDIAANQRSILSNSNACHDLLAYGLLQEDGRGVKISGELLRQTVINRSVSSHTKTIVASQPSRTKTQPEPGDISPNTTINVVIRNSNEQQKQDAPSITIGGDLVGHDRVDKTAPDVERE